MKNGGSRGIEDMKKEAMSVTRDWRYVNRQLIQNAEVREVKNVPGANGSVTEIFRKDWTLGNGGIAARTFRRRAEIAARRGQNGRSALREALRFARGSRSEHRDSGARLAARFASCIFTSVCLPKG